MKSRTLLLAIVVLVSAQAGRAQCGAGDTECVKSFVNHFPPLQSLEFSLKEDVDQRPAEAIESSAGGNSKHLGRWGAFDSLFLDNVKLHADGTYSETLKSSLEPNTNVLAPLKLSGAQFIPTYSITYEVKLGQLTKAGRTWVSANQVQRDRASAYSKELESLRMDYVQFEQLRAAFLAGVTKSDSNASSFYQLKAQAVKVLAEANYPRRVLNPWLEAEIREPAAVSQPARQPATRDANQVPPSASGR
jgi:hypothetical protein